MLKYHCDEFKALTFFDVTHDFLTSKRTPRSYLEGCLDQIASKDGGGGKMLLRFFDWCPRDVFLSVRSDNTNACNFYDKIGMKLIGTHNWAKGTVPGKVYVKRKFN